MACGCPPVVSTTGALPEIAGEAGVLADPFDPAALAAALERVWADPAERAALSGRCVERAREFTWARCAEKTLAVLNSLA
jgi:glycosyltransferase involved in cell wall biosynthesis